jgi:predicted nucleic acid-binding protein
VRLYLDANVIIYSIEGTPEFRGPALDWMARAQRAPLGQIMTSRISRLECRSKPSAGNTALLALYDRLFALLLLRDVSAELIEHATDLRARFTLRALDALHLATAIREQADVFLTGDKRLARCTEINVTLLG